MSVKAYILANVQAGTGEDVVETLSDIEGVKSAYNVTGPHDVIALVEVPDLELLDVGRPLVVSKGPSEGEPP